MTSIEQIKVVSYGGYYSTGGSVVRDIFREFEPNFELSIEFRLIKERFGLLDLERTILHDYAPESIDLAIRDFVWLASNLARKSGRFKKAGFSYDARTNDVFSASTSEFIDEISDYQYPMSWHFYDFKRSYFSQIYRRFWNKVLTRNVRIKEGDTLATLSYPGKEKYFLAAKKYINSILSGIQDFNNCDKNSVVGLHNAIPCFSVELIDRSIAYFSSCKIILIDRDPRDVFINYPKDSYGRYLPKTDNLMEKVKSFVYFYKSIRVNQQSVINHPNVLFLKFEDVCFDYEKMLQKILDFSEVDKSEHINKGAVFSPEQSRKNIGMWKNCEGEMKKAISYIEKELSEYLYTEGH